jgi:hypothetical protein
VIEGTLSNPPLAFCRSCQIAYTSYHNQGGFAGEDLPAEKDRPVRRFLIVAIVMVFFIAIAAGPVSAAEHSAGFLEKNCGFYLAGVWTRTSGMTYHVALNPGYPSGQGTIGVDNNWDVWYRASVADFTHIYDANGFGGKVVYYGTFTEGATYCTIYQ